MVKTIVSLAPRFESIETILRTKRFRPHAQSIRVLVPLWIKSDEEAKKIVIETTLRSIVEFLEHAPGFQEKGDQGLTTKEVTAHMRDVSYRTSLTPCVAKILEVLQYAPEELYALSCEDFKRLEVMILAVRTQLQIDLPPPDRVKGVKDAVAIHGLKRVNTD